MIAGTPTPRTAAPRRQCLFGPGLARRCLAAGVLAAGLTGVGCKSKETAGGSTRNNDPLVVGPGRIPKQSLPIPDRGTAGAKGRNDPLLSAPVGRTGERSGSGYTEDPDRFKGGPYLPNAAGTPAALAGRAKDDGDTLRLDMPGGVTLTPVGGSVAGPAGRVPADLAPYRVQPSDYAVSRENGQFVVEVKVPIAEGGPRRGYKGAGPTEAAAVQQVVDQIRAERK